MSVKPPAPKGSGASSATAKGNAVLMTDKRDPAAFKKIRNAGSSPTPSPKTSNESLDANISNKKRSLPVDPAPVLTSFDDISFYEIGET
ncbi:hypothetical protein AAVH_41662, partial [Aphelenchoides avenae]